MSDAPSALLLTSFCSEPDRVVVSCGGPRLDVIQELPIFGPNKALCSWGTFPIILSLICGLCVNVQIKGNTLVMVAADDTTSIFVADSRMVQLRVGQKPKVNDAYCKIAAVKNKLLFAYHGTAVPGLDPNELLVREALREIQVGPQSEQILSAIIIDWETATSEAFKALPSEIKRLVIDAAGGGDLVGGAYFAMLLHDDRIARTHVIVETDGVSLHYEERHVASIEGGGELAVPNVFFGKADKPDYVRRIFDEWGKIQPPIEEELKTVVQVAIEHPQPPRAPFNVSAVGGHVNEAKLTRAGIQWLTNNQECRSY